MKSMCIDFQHWVLKGTWARLQMDSNKDEVQHLEHVLSLASYDQNAKLPFWSADSTLFWAMLHSAPDPMP